MLNTVEHGAATNECIVPPTKLESAAHPVWPTIAAALLGIAIVLGVGFGPGTMHNVAHDTRHTLVFPCH